MGDASASRRGSDLDFKSDGDGADDDDDDNTSDEDDGDDDDSTQSANPSNGCCEHGT
jgi:hypothetical protein